MNQVRSYSKRLKLPGAVTEQAEEYHRLAEVKCSSSLRTEPSLTLVCIDLACVKLGEPVNKVRGIKSQLQATLLLTIIMHLDV